jgi:hypothetical protein
VSVFQYECTDDECNALLGTKTLCSVTNKYVCKLQCSVYLTFLPVICKTLVLGAILPIISGYINYLNEIFTMLEGGRTFQLYYVLQR